MSGNAVESKGMSFEQYSNADKLLEAFPLGFDTQGTQHLFSFAFTINLQ